MDTDRLVLIREERSRRMGTRIPGYSERHHVIAEQEYCKQLYSSLRGLRVVNVTDRSIEEVSDWIARNVL
jgi:regulator of PEP synthase PpsR (kinase-PPPase family)